MIVRQLLMVHGNTFWFVEQNQCSDRKRYVFLVTDKVKPYIQQIMIFDSKEPELKGKEA